MRRLLSLLLLLPLVACSSDSDDKPSSIPTTVYSPNGEPLSGGPLGRLTCEQATGNWFKRISVVGHISETDFISDAERQFKVMDIDHKGYIVSEELDRYREPYLHQTYVQSKSEETSSFFRKHKSKNEAIKSDPTLSVSDPVMSADTNLDFKVTPDEFIRQAHNVFAKLDANHDGALDRQEIMDSCKPKKP